MQKEGFGGHGVVFMIAMSMPYDGTVRGSGKSASVPAASRLCARSAPSLRINFRRVPFPAPFARTVPEYLSIGQASSSLAMQNGWVSLTARYKEQERTSVRLGRGNPADARGSL